MDGYGQVPFTCIFPLINYGRVFTVLKGKHARGAVPLSLSCGTLATHRRSSLCLLDIEPFPFTQRMSCSTVVYIVLVSKCNLHRIVLESFLPAFKPNPLMSSSLIPPRVLPLGIPYGFALKALMFLCYDFIMISREWECILANDKNIFNALLGVRSRCGVQ